MAKKTENQRYEIICVGCKKKVNEQKYHTRCPKCDDALDVIYNYDDIAKRLNRYDLEKAPISSQKYLDLLPIEDFRNVITLQEGGTQLYKTDKVGKKFKLKNLYIKNEGANPTGVFKDRGTFVEITKAVEAGAKALIIASSGNMAASCTAYASKAGLKIHVLVPENTPIGKLSQIMSYGAHVIKIRGDYSRCVHLVQKLAPRHGLYLVGDYVFRREGQKTLAFELVEQFCFQVPDVVIVPTGAGTHIAGIWKGFLEYKKLGFIDSLPKMVAVQPDGCAVLYDSFKKKKKSYKPWEDLNTICSAVAVADPVDGKMALKAVYDSGGSVISAGDQEALDAQHLLASKEGIFSEPSSALSVAAVPHLIRSRIIGKNDTVVCIATGNGLKDPMTPLQTLKPPRTFEADWKVVSRYLGSVHR
jgi:threonine synthase